MTLAEKLRTIIDEEAASLEAPPPGKACPMDRNGQHRWQRPYAQWAKFLAAQRCNCGAMPPSPEM